MDRIRDFYDETSLIKIIYGIRRSGKSVIMKQIIEELLCNGVDEKHIIYMNFEDLEFSDIRTARELDLYVKSIMSDDGIYYLLIDEVQIIEEFENGINSLRVTDKVSVFVTGSNSRITFSELSTNLSGRYVSFKVTPLSFKEIILLTDVKEDEYENLLFDVFVWGSLPQRFSFTNDDARKNYITDVYSSIILKDVVERCGIKDINSFNKILQYLLEIEGRKFSATNIIDYLKKNQNEISTQTLYIYLEALCSTFILNKVHRFDVVGKGLLKTLPKYYVSDLGIKKIKSNQKEVNYSISLENLVYNELCNKGYEVYVGKLKNGEIDFIAKKNNEFKYIQVSLYLSSEDTLKREFGAFDNIVNSNLKYVISLDKIDYSRGGIKHVNIFDFLLDDEF